MNKLQLGEAIAAERKAQGISIRKMAQMANTSTRAIQAIEKGWYNVGIDSYLAMINALEVDLQLTKR